MVVGEPSLMGGEFGDEDERLITRLENTQYDAANSMDHENNHGGGVVGVGPGGGPGGGGQMGGPGGSGGPGGGGGFGGSGGGGHVDSPMGAPNSWNVDRGQGGQGVGGGGGGPQGNTPSSQDSEKKSPSVSQ